MGVVYGRYWKTNSEDIELFAFACSCVLKHPTRTEEELLTIAGIYDDLNNQQDITSDQRKIVTRKYFAITGKAFKETPTDRYDKPWIRGVNKIGVFQKTLWDLGIDIENFDPEKKWLPEPVVNPNTLPKVDLIILRNRGMEKVTASDRTTVISDVMERRKWTNSFKRPHPVKKSNYSIPKKFHSKAGYLKFSSEHPASENV